MNYLIRITWVFVCSGILLSQLIFSFDLHAGGPFFWSTSDSDNDGVVDEYDLDDDNDGIPDAFENRQKVDGISYEFYEWDNDWRSVDSMPSTGALSAGIIDHFEVSTLQSIVDPGDTDYFGIRYSGFIYLDSTTTYTFYTSSDDGSKLWINDSLIVDNDGLHSNRERSGSIDLDSGYHEIIVTFFEFGGNANLDVRYATSTITKQDIPFDILFPASDPDQDGDGLVNRVDLDSDNDGIPDLIEIGGIDIDGDGRVDNTTDTDGDGLVDIYDNDDTDGPLVSGCTLGTDCDLSGSTASWSDTDQDGIDDLIKNTDGDAYFDFLDNDSDGDMINDLMEIGGSDDELSGKVSTSGSWDIDLDGFADLYDPNVGDGPGSSGSAGTPLVVTQADTNGDGIMNNGEGLVSGGSQAIHHDGDNLPDYLDLDSDNDGILDLNEVFNCSNTLSYEFYDGATSGNTIVNIPTTGALSTGLVSEIDVDNLQNDVDPGDGNTFAVRYTGYIFIETADTYTFYTRSDDGSGLYINDVLIVDNDGLHGSRERSGSVYLSAGLHKFEVVFFENTGGEILEVSYSSPSISKVEIPFDIFYSNCDYDFDDDGVLNYADLDTDNDGIPDLVESGGSDPDGDGRVNSLTDADADGIMDIIDQDLTDGPGLNPCHPDSTCQTNSSTSALFDRDGDGANETSFNKDGDSLQDYLDLDSDNDGIPDLVESGASDPFNKGIVDTTGGTWDIDADGLADVYDQNAGDGPGGSGTNGTALIIASADTNTNGVVDGAETFLAGGTNFIHFDNDEIPNHLDLDADNDGITDVIENAGGDLTADNGGSGDLTGTVDNFTDADSNGWNDTNISSTLDTDSDGIPDYSDLDSDNDGIPDYVEGVCTSCPTAAGPGGSTTDTDNNGVLDFFENMSSDNTDNSSGSNVGASPNFDNDDSSDSLADYIDPDTDEDGSYDWAEGFDLDGDGEAYNDIVTIALNYETANANPGDYPSTDTDGDDLPDWLDNQAATPGYQEGVVPPFLNAATASWVDNNNNGLADLFDPDQNGTMAPTPDFDSANDDDWRDNATAISLPVELAQFEAKAEGCNVQVMWTSASEELFNFYELERSTNGTDFVPIKRIYGTAGNSAQSYDYLDEEAQTYNYYRLKMVDLDGTYEYSEVIFVTTDCSRELERKMVLYPNPVSVANDKVFLKFYSVDMQSKLYLSGQNGLLVKVFNQPIQEGWNSFVIDISELPAGTYFITNERKSGRIITKTLIVTEE